MSTGISSLLFFGSLLRGKAFLKENNWATKSTPRNGEDYLDFPILDEVCNISFRASTKQASNQRTTDKQPKQNNPTPETDQAQSVASVTSWQTSLRVISTEPERAHQSASWQCFSWLGFGTLPDRVEWFTRKHPLYLPRCSSVKRVMEKSSVLLWVLIQTGWFGCISIHCWRFLEDQQRAWLGLPSLKKWFPQGLVLVRENIQKQKPYFKLQTRVEDPRKHRERETKTTRNPRKH